MDTGLSRGRDGVMNGETTPRALSVVNATTNQPRPPTSTTAYSGQSNRTEQQSERLLANRTACLPWMNTHPETRASSTSSVLSVLAGLYNWAFMFPRHWNLILYHPTNGWLSCFVFQP